MTSFTRISRLSAGIAVSLATAATVASMAAAAGEPKNQAPFTRSAVPRVLTQQLGTAHVSVAFAVRGEPKNQLPFTRR